MRTGDSHMRSALVIVTMNLVLNLGNGFVLAQTGGEWRWLLSLHMFDPQTGWAVGSEGMSGNFAKGAVASVVRTTDGGLHWKDVTPHPPPGQSFPQGAGGVHALSKHNAWVLADFVTMRGSSPALNPVVFHTIDGGETWRSALFSVDGFMWLMDFIDSNNGWALSGKLLNDRWYELYGIHRSTDGGKTWTKIGSAQVGSAKTPGVPLSISFRNSTMGWIVGVARDGNYVRAHVLMTQDGGHTWQQQKLSLPSRLTSPEPGLMPVSPRFVTSLDGILPVFYSGVNDAGALFYLTHDGGTTWSKSTPIVLAGLPTGGGAGLGPPQTAWWSFADINHGWATFGDQLYVTIDGGLRWTEIRLARPLGEIGFISPQVGWSTGGQLSQRPSLGKTLDGGRTWTSVPYVIVR
jgi:photosystem II stability/assembly factor-like uncharacterized protein